MAEEGKNPPVTVPTPKKGSVTRVIAQYVAVFAVIGIVVWAMLFHQGPWPWETPPAMPTPLPADVELYRFSDLASWSNMTNGTVNVELWVKNTGEETAREISVFVRVRDQDGSIKYVGVPDLTWEILRENETASAVYMVHYYAEDTYLEHTIEVRWQSGMHGYLKRTELRQ